MTAQEHWAEIAADGRIRRRALFSMGQTTLRNSMASETQSVRTDSAGHRAPGVPSAEKGIFRKEGEYWTVGCGGKPFLLKDTKGLGYLAHLLRYPGTEFHVLDLVSGLAAAREDDVSGQSSEHDLPRGAEDLEKAGIHITSLGDAGEMLDEQAKAAYRRRLTELREELEEAKEFGNPERAEQAEDEIDALTRELSRAVGLGGRNRKSASASERARQTITRSIKSVLERIAQSDAALGTVLTRRIKTGTFCSYQPDPDFPIAWEFAAADSATAIEPAEQHPGSNDDPAPAPADHRTAPAVLEVSPFSIAERTGFVGRESEVSAIRAAIDRALSGHGSIVMLAGGPGVGKTRLAMEISDYASRVGFRCLAGHCYERDEPFPYLPFAEILESSLAQAASLDEYRRRMGDNAAELAQIAPSLRRVFPDIPQPLELLPAQQRRYLFQSFAEALERATRTRSYLNVLEDLHWADESTLALLNYLANRIVQLPLVIIGTYREVYVSANSALVRTLEELIRIGVRPLKLSGLSKDAVAQMLNELSQRQAPESLVRAIFEESQGNPFFVEEVFRHLREEGKVFDAAGQFRSDIEIGETDVPENVRLVISRRLERLSANEQRVLAAAAVIGRSFSFRLLTEISQIDVDELFSLIEKAQQMGVIVPSSEGPDKPFTFTHELVRQTLLAGFSAPRRQQSHAAIADAIERLCPRFAEERAGEIGDHLLKAGSFADGKKLFHYQALAGKSALEAAAFEEARRNFQSALSHQGALDPRQKANLLASLAMAEQGLERWNTALANLREVVEIYINLGDREMISRSFAELTDTLFFAGRLQETAETARRGLAYLQADVSADRVRLLATLGLANGGAGAYEPADEALRDGLNIASQLSDPKLEARVRGARSTVNVLFYRLREAAADGFLCEQRGGSETPPWQRCLQLRALHQTLLFLGRPVEALRIADDLEPLARKIGDNFSVARCLTTRAWTEFGKAPDLAKLEIGLGQLSKYGQSVGSGFWESVFRAQLSLVDFFRGNWTGAMLLAQASCSHEVGSAADGTGSGTLFRYMAYAGDRAGALSILDEKSALIPRRGQPNAFGSWLMLVLVIEGLFILGEQSQAGEFYPLVRELIDTGAVVLWSISRFTQTIAGVAAAAARQWEAAEDHFRIARQQAEFFPDCLEQAEIKRFHAMMLIDRAASGDRGAAQTLLNEALETYERIGMPRHVEMTQALFN
jgi:tetratricopeptide (TPR) repeat protein